MALAARLGPREVLLTTSISSKGPFLSACQLPCNLSRISADKLFPQALVRLSRPLALHQDLS